MSSVMDEKCHILELPPEIVLRIIDHVYSTQEIRVERALPEHPEDTPRYYMRNVSLSAQFLRTCRLIHQEAQPLLYANNIFNCSQREGLKLLLQSIGSKNFSSIKHVIIDWEQLQDFAWSLAKEEYSLAVSGLRIIELATWRMRIMGGSSIIQREVRSYDRQLYQSALDICEKHPRLKIVAQRTYNRPNRIGHAHRVKWRFIASESDLMPDEKIVPVSEELAQLKTSSQSEAGGSGASLVIDPF